MPTPPPPLAAPPGLSGDTDEVDLLSVALAFARKRRLIAAVTVAMGIVGLALAVTLPSTYTANATLVREASGDLGSLAGGLSALRSFGISVGAEASGLSVEAFPDLLMSREVQLAVLADTVYAPRHGGDVQVQKVLLEPSLAGRAVYLLMAPARWVRDDPPPAGRRAGGPRALSEADQMGLGLLRETLVVDTDLDNGLMTVSASAEDPHFAAALVERAVYHLTERVRQIQTQKADQNLAFVETRLNEADAEMRRANARLAAFEDQNRNIQSARLRVDRDRLEQDLSFKRQVYTELRTELTRAELERQRSEPVITFVDRPVVPAFPSGPSRGGLVVGFVLLGLGVGCALAIVSAYAAGADAESRAKLAELRGLWPRRLRRGRGKA